MKWVVSVVSAALMLTLGAFQALAEEIPGSFFKSGNWQGAAYTFDDTGRFSHCVISASYISGDTLLFSVNDDVSISVAVVSPALRLSPGQTFPVRLTIDRRQSFEGTATALGTDFASLTINDFANALFALQKGRTLVIESPAGNGIYDLTGTFRALEAAKACAVAHYGYSSAPVANATAAVSTPAAAAPAAIDKTMLFQIATGMISDLEIKDSRYFTPQEVTEYFGNDLGVFWTSASTGIMGGAFLGQGAVPVDLRSTDASDLAILAQGCTGDIASASRDAMIPGFIARELRTRCVTEQGSFDKLTTKLLLDGMVLYTVLIFDTQSGGTPEARQEMSEGVALRAASFVKGQGGG